jgi:transposase-like protein
MNELTPITQVFNTSNIEDQKKIVDTIYSKITLKNSLFDICENINRKKIKVCPHCGKSHFMLYGKSKGVQNYKCKKCGKRFNEFTGSCISYVKKKHLLKPFILEMLSGSSLKECAKLLSLSIQTTFDWRHKIIAALAEHVPKQYSGIIEMIEYLFPFSKKGQGAKAKKIGEKGKINSVNGNIKKNKEQVSVIVVNDRNKKIEFKVIKKGKVSELDLKNTFSSKFKSVKKLCIDQNSSLKKFAIGKKFSYYFLENHKRIKGKNKYFNTENSHKMIFDLMFWMERFKGVSSTYLQNYLFWFLLIEQIKYERDLTSTFLEKSIQVTDGKEKFKKCRMFV